MNDIIIDGIVNNLGIKKESVIATLNLLDEGATIPFIARYRKERTGNRTCTAGRQHGRRGAGGCTGNEHDHVKTKRRERKQEYEHDRKKIYCIRLELKPGADGTALARCKGGRNRGNQGL